LVDRTWLSPKSDLLMYYDVTEEEIVEFLSGFSKGIYEFEGREVGFNLGSINGMVMEFGDELREIKGKAEGDTRGGGEGGEGQEEMVDEGSMELVHSDVSCLSCSDASGRKRHLRKPMTPHLDYVLSSTLITMNVVSDACGTRYQH